MTLVTMLTTTDNPYDPFDEWDEWYSYDCLHGYNTCEFLARFAAVSDEQSNDDQGYLIDHAIEEIVQLNINGMYKKITKDVKLDENYTKN